MVTRRNWSKHNAVFTETTPAFESFKESLSTLLSFMYATQCTVNREIPTIMLHNNRID